MERQVQVSSSNDLIQLFETKRNETISACKEIAGNEFDLFEFNLFLSSMGKENLDESTKKVSELREKVDKGETDLKAYEEMFDSY
jgi:hypothetical protein